MKFVPEIAMFKLVICIFSLFFALSTSQIVVRSADAASETDNVRYVSELLVMSIRDKMEKPNKVVGVVHTGDSVRVLEEHDNFVKIETADKKEGWIGKQYLTKEVPGSTSEQQLKQEIADLKKQLQTKTAGEETTGADKTKNPAESCAVYQQKLNDADKMIQQLQEQQRKQTANLPSNSERGQDPEISAQLEDTSQRYNQLIVEYEKRGREIAELQNSIAKQDDTTRFLWFGAGAVVFFLGLLAGRSANRKKNKFLY